MSALFSVNLDVYTVQFKARVSADLISLRLVEQSIRDKTYSKYAEKETDGMTFQIQVPEQNEDLISYELEKTFISIMRNVNDYLDRMVSVINLSKKLLAIPYTMSIDQANIYLTSRLDEELSLYCQKSKETFPVKLNRFKPLSNDLIKHLTAYNTLRNCFEHHKSITEKQLQIPIKKVGLFTEDGSPVKIGKIIRGGSKISVKFSEKTIGVIKGDTAKLTSPDIEAMVLYLSTQMPTEITSKMKSLVAKK